MIFDLQLFAVINNESVAGGINFNNGETNVVGTADVDLIYNEVEYATIDAGDGNDYIRNWGDNAMINAGVGNDSIYNLFGDYATINAGVGDDTIKNEGDSVMINAGDGNDYIYNECGDYTLINAGVGNDNVVNYYGWYATINAGDGNDYIKTYGDDVSINAGDGNDYIKNDDGENVSINAGAGNDTIKNDWSDNVSINAGDGNDYIKNEGGSNVSINAGTGDDSIKTYGFDATINAGAGNDTISFYYSSIWNDTDDAEYTVIEYAAGDGHDIINGYNSDDTIRITDGSAYSTASSGTDVIIKVGLGSLTLKYASDKTINIVGGSDVSSLPKGVNLNITGKTLTVKKPFEGTINSTDYGSKVKTINASSNKGMVELIGNDLNNVIKASKGGSTLEGAGGKDHLTCGKGADVIRYADGDGKDTIKKFDGTQDKLIITDGAIDSVKVKGKNVKLKVGEGSITIQKAVGQEITIKDESGAKSTYAFTKKNNTLDTALVSTSGQLSVTKYWFEVDVQTDPLEGLLNNKNAALGADDIIDRKEIFKTAATDEITFSARHRHNK